MINTHPLLELVGDKGTLSRLADHYGTPLYLYSGARLKANLQCLNTALSNSFEKYNICYAIKANNNYNLVREMKSYLPTLCADCSSPGELFVAQKAGIPLQDCIYTGNYESCVDLQVAFDSGCHINLDDISSLERLKQIGIPAEISFRLNPGFGKGAFWQITTAGEKAKFGVPRYDILNAYSLAQEAGIQNFGIQCMTGSGILEAQYFDHLLAEILDTAQEIEKKLKLNFTFISIGGGFGIPYHEDDKPLDIQSVFSKLGAIFYSYYRREKDTTPALWVEPGKYLVGDAGILLTRVTGVKHSYRKFIGLDAGMETFMRPALYNAYHRIYKVGEPDADVSQTVDFTGRICENTDRLAVDRPFPEVREEDLIAIMDVGAYGFSMAHQFNTRPRPAEVLLQGTEHTLIRKRETIEDLFKKCDV